MDKPLTWFKSTASANGQSCVECAWLPGGGIAVRDSKHPHGAVLSFTAPTWHAFIAGVRIGEFDKAI